MIEKVGWCAAAERGLVVSAGDDMDVIAQEVKSGVSELWRFVGNVGRGYLVTRIENMNDRRELVLVLGEGKGFFEAAPIFIALARIEGMSFRTHVKRRGLVRMWQRLGLNIIAVDGDYKILGWR